MTTPNFTKLLQITFNLPHSHKDKKRQSLNQGLSAAFVGIYNLISASAVSINWGIGTAAGLFCAVIGVLFGSYPAAKASKLQPIDALHSA